MTGTPCACAFVATWTPAPSRSTSTMTEQPWVSCWSAKVAYFATSASAFWMFVFHPMAAKPFSHRLDESASGSMTQAVLSPPAAPLLAAAAGVELLLELLLLPHPAASRVTAAVAASTPVILDVMRIHYSFVTGSKQFRTLCRLRAWSPKPAASRCDTPETFSIRRARFFPHDR